MSESVSHASVMWKGSLADGDGVATVGSGAIGSFPVSWQARVDRTGEGTSPEELLAAAHASCYAMAFSGALTREGHPPERLDVSAACAFAKNGRGYAVTAMQLEVVGVVPGMAYGEFCEVAEQAKLDCPVSRALAGVTISLKARLAQTADSGS